MKTSTIRVSYGLLMIVLSLIPLIMHLLGYVHFTISSDSGYLLITLPGCGIVLGVISIYYRNT